ncbi:hypothetical protein [Niastella sp. OAS944]|uniref:hypothetical protein n=1 Tax=Niastella sp. OAS944 TaxID=2664089 RepID=UPI00348B38FD|nr:hypothetical protein [Chitinophagaceae bacterium OAS944]
MEEIAIIDIIIAKRNTVTAISVKGIAISVSINGITITVITILLRVKAISPTVLETCELRTVNWEPATSALHFSRISLHSSPGIGLFWQFSLNCIAIPWPAKHSGW